MRLYVDKHEPHIDDDARYDPLDAGRMEIVWRCTDCGHVQARRDELPDGCPNCGAPREAFVLVEED